MRNFVKLLAIAAAAVSISPSVQAQSPSPWREPGTQWNAVVEDYEIKGYRDFLVDDWHVWQALKSGTP